MIKSPSQWAQTFANLANTDDMVITTSFRVDQIQELKNMMSILNDLITVDDLREVLERLENK